MLVVSAALVTAAVVTSAAVAERPSRSPETRPAALWNAFPLRVTPTRASVRPAVRLPRAPDAAVALPRPAAPAVVRHEAPSGLGTDTILVITVLLGSAGLAAYFVLRGPAGRWSQAMGAAGHAFGTTPRLVSVLSPRRATEQGYLLHLPGRTGFGDRVVERAGPPPVPGEVIVDDELGDPGQTYVVQAVRRSPIPGDRRPCAELRIV
jgi:hypothetical protein